MTTQPHDDRQVPADTFEMRLVIARTHAGLKATEAALLVGVSGQTWRNWEDGASGPAQKPAMLRYIAEQLGVDEDWLRDGGPLSGAGRPSPDGPVALAEVSSTHPYQTPALTPWRESFTPVAA